jgi:hypothetical protein
MKLPFTIYEVVVPKGKRSTKSLGYFVDESVAKGIAEATSPLVLDDGSERHATINSLLVDRSESLEEYSKASIVAAALEKLSGEERAVLGL